MTAGEMLRSYLLLGKVRISFFASLSAATGLLLADRPPGTALPLLLTAGVFLLACGACALNQYQERNTDALMGRTAGRPIPAGRIRAAAALRFAAVLIGSGGTLLLLTGSWAAPLLGLAAVLWYNGTYTRMKRRSAFAVIPGALVGAVPPAIGWIAGGGLFDPALLALCFFFFMWQVPHFLVHLLAFGKEYEAIGHPSLTAVFTEAQLDRLTFHWLFAAAVSLQLIIIYGLIWSPLVRIAILAASFWLVANGLRLLREGKPGYPGLFRGINYFMLAVMLLLFLDRLPGHLGQ